MTFPEMAALAQSKLNPQIRSKHVTTGVVAAVLEAANGKVYAGLDVSMPCGLGICAERAAAMSMVADGEVIIRRLVCLDECGKLIMPCGTCREFIRLLSPEQNPELEILVSLDPLKTIRLAALLPTPWTQRCGVVFDPDVAGIHKKRLY